MKNIFNNKKTVTLAVSLTFFVITALSLVAAFLGGKIDNLSSSSQPSESILTQAPIGEDEITEVPDVNVEETIVFDIPDSMKGVSLFSENDSEIKTIIEAEDKKAAIDDLIKRVKEQNMNSLIVPLTYDGVCLATLPNRLCADPISDGDDVLSYIIDKADSEDVYVYVIYDILGVYGGAKDSPLSSVDSDDVNLIAETAAEFAKKYTVSGIMLRDFYFEDSAETYAAYRKSASLMGYENYMLGINRVVVNEVCTKIRSINKRIQIGLYADSVWSNAANNENGSETSADFTMLDDGHCDAVGLIKAETFDFVTVSALSSLSDKKVPFETVVKWWCGIASESGVPVYIVHAEDKLASASSGFTSPDQVVNQLIKIKDVRGYAGSVFNSLAGLEANRDGSTDVLEKFYSQELDDKFISRTLTMSNPAYSTFTTYDPSVNIIGSADPNFKVTLNGKKVDLTENGYFSIRQELKIGANRFVIAHKDKTVTYNITHKIKVLTEMSPMGSIAVDGGSKIKISAVAYNGSKVYAKINGTTVTMTADENGDTTDADYSSYSGYYTAPAGTSSVQKLGNVVVYGTWGDFNESLKGAAISVNKVANMGKIMTVTANVAETFTTDLVDDFSVPTCYPLPKGAQDYIVGNEIVFNDGKTTFKYYKTKSGKRLYTKDISITDSVLEDNKISSVSITSDNAYTYITAAGTSKTPYSIELSPLAFTGQSGFMYTLTADFAATKMTVYYDLTSSMPTTAELESNPLFKSAKVSTGTKNGETVGILTLELKNAGALFGVVPYYDDNGALVLRFNNPLPVQKADNKYGYTLNGARITIDPGHGKGDPGALGVGVNGYYEANINQAIADELEKILKELGAEVHMNTSWTEVLLISDRLNQAKEFDSQLFVSIHCNSAGAGAKGTEAYYFNPFSQRLAESICDEISSYMAKDLYGATSGCNRGDKFGYYGVTRDYDFPSTLIECGFVSNAKEYNWLIKPETQKGIAEAIARGIIANYVNLGVAE